MIPEILPTLKTFCANTSSTILIWWCHGMASLIACRQTSSVGCTKKTWMFLVLSCSCLCPIHWSQVLSLEWKCSWSSANRQCSNYIWVINNFIAFWGASYIRGFMVYYRPFVWTVRCHFSHAHIIIVTSHNALCNQLWRHQQNTKEQMRHGVDVNLRIIFFILINAVITSCKKSNNACTAVKNCLSTHLSVILLFIK